MGFLKKLFESGKNFKYLDNLIHSGAKEIILDSDIVLKNKEENNYKYGIKLDVDNLVIDGNGHTIDAKGKTRIFNCSGKNITLKNIMLKNGYSKQNGGAIDNSADLTIINSAIMENTVKENGGAINNSGKLTITDSTLNNNTAIWYGGAINNIGDLSITESIIEENTANRRGGAIFNAENASTLITNSTFTKNTTVGDSGIIINLGELTIMDSIITKNILPKYREAILNNAYFRIFNCEISNNSSYQIIYNTDYMEVQNTKFIENKVENNIINNAKEGNLTINAIFMGNSAFESIILNNGKICTIDRSSFKNNISQNNSHIIINDSDLTLISPKIDESILNNGHIFLKNSSKDFLGKIFGEGAVDVDTDLIPKEESFDFGYLDKKIHESSSKEIVLNEDICFKSYESYFYEGGLELDIDDLIIDGNGNVIDGSNMSRIFIITGKNITLKNIIFKNGHTFKNYSGEMNKYGGAIKVNHGSELTLEKCKFINNVSESEGGAIHSRGKLNISQSILNNNTAESEGGAIYSRDKLSISQSELNNNSSESKGGAIHNHKSELTIEDSTLAENASENGGAICNNEGSLSITDSTLTRNTSESEGGAIYSRGKLSISQSILNNNTAEYEGGAIYNHGELTITDSSFTGNTSNWHGGAIENFEAISTIIKSIFAENTSKKNGGALSNYKCTLTIKESKLMQNSAKKKGGSIYNINCDLSISDSTLSNNTSEDYGGAICNYGELTITDSSLTENTSKNGGGAIYNHEDKLTISDSTINNNHTQSKGGAIRNRGELTITDSSLNNNSAESEGGAINNSSVLTITDSTLIGNAAKGPFGEGGAIMNLSDGMITLLESELIENAGKMRGGAILNYGEMILNGCNFDFNIADEEYTQDIYNDGKLTLKEITFTNPDKSILNNKICHLKNETKEKICNHGKIFTPLAENDKSFTYLNQLIKENPSKVILDYDIKLDWYNDEENKYRDGLSLDIDNIIIDGNGHTIDAKGKTRIFHCSGKNITLKNIILKNGFAKNGGAIYNCGELKIKESLLNKNDSEYCGGAILNKGILTIIESKLNYNTAQSFGGAIENYGTELTLKDSLLSENTAGYSGGAIYLNKSSKKYVSDNCTFNNNKPDDVYN